MNVSETSLLSLVRTIYQWRKQLMKVAGAAFVLSAIISLLLPNYYRAYTKAIPNSAAAVMPKTLFEGGGVVPYGDADDLDRLQNFAGSTELIDFLIQKFHLYKHYDIDSTNALARHTIGLHIEKLYSVAKDEFGGVEIAVEDRDPKMAADLANAAIERVAELDREAATANLKAMADTYEKSVQSSAKAIDSFSYQIDKINRTYKYSSIALRRELLVQATPGMTADAQLGLIQRADRMSADSLASITENLYKAGVLDSRRADMNGRYIGDNGLYLRTKAALASGVKTLQVIERATPPPVKSRPKRAILVLFATFAALVASVVGIIVFEQYKDVKWKALLTEEGEPNDETKPRRSFFTQK
jgi:tyrosine-protein kinase Etk/Wzc